MTRLAVSAGEISGDRLGASLVGALRADARDLTMWGIGGPRLRAMGLDALARSEDLAVMGIAEVAGRLPALWNAMRRFKKRLAKERPDGLVLVDYPDFNLRLAAFAHRIGIPVVYLVSPQLWAWRPERIDQIRRDVRHMLVILPFEKAFYDQHGVPATFIGHPFADTPPPRNEDRAHHRALLGLPADRPVVLLGPGSRMGEARRHLPILARSVTRLRAESPDLIGVVSCAPGLKPADLEPLAPGCTVSQAPFSQLVAAADAAVVASGTACLEAALTGTPLCVVYRVHPLTWRVAQRKVRVPFAALPNLLLNRAAVPELLQDDMKPDVIAEQVKGWIGVPAAADSSRAIRDEVVQLLKGPGWDLAADITRTVLKREPTDVGAPTS